MKVLPLDPIQNASPEALLGFLGDCQQQAKALAHDVLVSISITVDAMDPLAVLEAIYEPGHPHFYAEHPSNKTALAGAEVAMRFETEGANRFLNLQEWSDSVFARTIAVGDVEAAFGGPHIFVAAAFAPDSHEGEPFPALMAFVPSWQVARAGEITTAVANICVGPVSDLAQVSERILRAHSRFGRISYSESKGSSASSVNSDFRRSELGDFKAIVGEAVSRIQGGAFDKIVLARAIDLEANQEFHPLVALDGLRQRFPDCFSFSVANGQGESFIGASPERLVRVSRGMLESDVLAGSIRRGVGAGEDARLGAELLSSEKDQREHRLVLESVKSRLSELGLDSEHPASPRLRKLANVQHLHTPVHAELGEKVRLLETVAKLHPTPAVGGTPQDPALAAIPGLEQFNRGLYAGALGWMNARGGGEFMVGIRSALVSGNTARVFAGAGIVDGSTPQKEWDETELKFKALLEGLLPR